MGRNASIEHFTTTSHQKQNEYRQVPKGKTGFSHWRLCVYMLRAESLVGIKLVNRRFLSAKNPFQKTKEPLWFGTHSPQRRPISLKEQQAAWAAQKMQQQSCHTHGLWQAQDYVQLPVPRQSSWAWQQGGSHHSPGSSLPPPKGPAVRVERKYFQKCLTTNDSSLPWMTGWSGAGISP